MINENDNVNKKDDFNKERLGTFLGKLTNIFNNAKYDTIIVFDGLVEQRINVFDDFQREQIKKVLSEGLMVKVKTIRSKDGKYLNLKTIEVQTNNSILNNEEGVAEMKFEGIKIDPKEGFKTVAKTIADVYSKAYTPLTKTYTYKPLHLKIFQSKNTIKELESEVNDFCDKHNVHYRSVYENDNLSVMVILWYE